MKYARFANIVVALLMLAALLPLPAQTVNAEPVQPRLGTGRLVNHEAQYVPGEIVVVFKSDVPQAEYKNRAQALAGSISAAVKDQRGDTALLKMDDNVDVYALSDQLAKAPEIEIAEPNFIYGHDTGPTPPPPDPNNPTPPPQSDEEKEMKAKKKTAKVPMFPNDEFNSWANYAISHHIVWPEVSKSGDVCLVDTGVDWNHPELKGKIVKGPDVVNDDSSPMDDNGHGTFIAGIIAATINNGKGIAGISNGKVVAIKALGSEGWGTTYDLGWAVQYCFLPMFSTINSRVKVINLSFGGFGESEYLYRELSRGINNYGKLVVAASANASTSNPSFPAAWGSSYWGNPFPQYYSVVNGLISVSSMAAPYDQVTWVDKNGNRMMENSEIYSSEQCATSFASYGPWIELVAPGEAIYSLTPVTDPFYDNYWYGVPEEYALMDGSSFASAITSAVAVRTWSVFPTWYNTDVENKLRNSGESVTIANDGYNFSGTNFHSNWGYWQSTSNDTYIPMTFNLPTQGFSVSYGQPFTYNLSGQYYNTVLAPYCWPTAGGYFTAAENTSNARILNLAAAMDRYAYRFSFRDANTGLPIVGATASVKNHVTGAVATTAFTDSKTSAYVYMVNLKTDVGYDFYVNKPGYTAGAQWLLKDKSESTGGYIYTHWWMDVGIPPISKNTSIVANYNRYFTPYESDLVVFLPNLNPIWDSENNEWIYIRGAVGPDILWNNEQDYISQYYGKMYYQEGTTTQLPYARYMSYNDLSMETITIKNYPGTGRPVFWGDYNIYITSLNGDTLNDSDPYIRIWRGGNIIGRITKATSCASNQNWWIAARIYGYGSTTYVDGNMDNYDWCGTRSNIWPY